MGDGKFEVWFKNVEDRKRSVRFYLEVEEGWSSRDKSEE